MFPLLFCLNDFNHHIFLIAQLIISKEELSLKFSPIPSFSLLFVQQFLLSPGLGVGWESQADILVITPGRLVEHLYSTPGFSLKFLEYIVIDEADRIVDSMQNNWLHHIDQHLNVQGGICRRCNVFQTKCKNIWLSCLYSSVKL